MSQVITEIVEGWTAALQYRLLSSSDPIDLTNYTVIPICEDKRGSVVSTSSDYTEDSTTGGEVSYLPGSTGTFKASLSPYTLQFQLVDASDKDLYVPSQEPIIIKVRPIGAL